MKSRMNNRSRIISAVAGIACALFLVLPASLTYALPCSDCHTMHNSQNGSAVDTSGANEFLLTRQCLECHTAAPAESVSSFGAPKVLSTGAPTLNLAGGDFYWVTTNDSFGHNVIELGGGRDGTLGRPPGHHAQGWENTPGPGTGADLACGGAYGCHGNRTRMLDGGTDNPLVAITGAHHENDNTAAVTQLTTAATTGTSYRFLLGTLGTENNGASAWQNLDQNTHNEYYGAAQPLDGSQGADRCASCHTAANEPNKNPQGTISGVCGSCHGAFHRINHDIPSGADDGVGTSTSSPFLRHPTDVVLPGAGTEYASYRNRNLAQNIYSVEAPVARPTVPNSISSNVTTGAGGNAIVMCLSCHYAHGSDQPDMLRWDYSGMDAGTSGATAGTGCFTCHTQKDNWP
jgi:hypothetical protein